MNILILARFPAHSKHAKKIVAVTINTTKHGTKITPQMRILAKENLSSHI